ncbi:hypothetical protein SERLADRAFT_404523 [Serpula lacrymans var. lacrymans S7.9]|uniref:Uncharacterized protein n=1 Tax=Serpula lacrymans var. lacrymans (strain S7.9) TaxID=578457 RepID=F8NDD8_SERL9|nr:uncharacterized protein SERLADRAFT_404523 [Serpula lacrymans var. lacrymans S7.9]EGO30276.1 hypothetical protein SERLADRAFT_404523 [Serpula lacrymans var. lacrymans S7.9]
MIVLDSHGIKQTFHAVFDVSTDQTTVAYFACPKKCDLANGLNKDFPQPLGKLWSEDLTGQEYKVPNPTDINSSFIVDPEPVIAPTSIFVQMFEHIFTRTGEIYNFTVPLISFMDVISGNVPKQWNKHHIVYMLNAAMPQEKNTTRVIVQGIRKNSKITRENKLVAEELVGIFQNVGVEAKIGIITMYNATPNDCAMEELADILSNKYSITNFDPIEECICCFAHIINLCSQAIIKSFSKLGEVDNNENLVNLNPGIPPFEASQQTWEQTAAQDLLTISRKFICAVRKSSYRQEQLQ